jgi:phage terminase small subunit
MRCWSGLSIREQRFVAEYIVDLDASRAAHVAGYTPDEIASLLIDAEINAVIQAEQHKLAELCRVRAEDVIHELRALAFARITDVVMWDRRGVVPLASAVLRPERAAAISEITHTTTMHGEKWSVKMHDKGAALDRLMRHLGLFEADNKRELNIPQLSGVVALPLTKDALPATPKQIEHNGG